MFSAAIFLIACAATAAIDPKTLNTTLFNREVLQKLSPILNSNRTLNEKNIALLNRTVQNLGVGQDIVTRLTELVRNNTVQNDAESKVQREVKSSSYDAYGDEIGNRDGSVRHVEESPDYASSVVLASDLLSLTSAVASVKETACREHGYKFLDGLIMNKRWALKRTSGLSFMTRNELYAIMKGSNESTFDGKLTFLEQHLLSSYSNDDIKIHGIKQKIANIKHTFKQKWSEARKTKARFEESNIEWLSGSVSLPATVFDASAKSPQGLLFGSSYHLGNFDECVAIEDPGYNGVTIEGQYCLATIKWRQKHETKKTRTGRGETLRWAVCVPSACNAKSVASFVSSVLAHTVSNTTGVEVSERDCYTRRPLAITSLDVAYLSLILLFLTIIFFSTLYETYTIYYGNKKESCISTLIICFSVINNMKKIISTKQHNTLGLECVSGIKALAMIFIIAGHACMFIASGPVMDADAWDRLVRQPVNAFMLNNTLLVDTFLMLSAFLFSRLFLVELEKRRGKVNVIPILIFRYIRVTPAYLVIILFYMTWLPKMGEGPLWQDRLQLEQERCMASWWTNILYINNYVNTDKMCMFQSWYLSVDTQLFFIAPIFIYSLWRWRIFGRLLISVAILLSLIGPAFITYKDNLDPTLLFYAKEFTDIISNFYFNEAYVKTHMKMIVYFIGILTGYILHRIQTENYQFSYLMKTCAWITSIVLGAVTTFSVTVFYQEWYQYSALDAAAYISFHKLAWGIANGWLIIACATGNAGVFGKLLTWKFLAPFSRLTFCAYLVNGIVELYYVGELRHPLHITFFTVMANAISHIVLTFFLAMFLCLMFESPLHGIEKILLRMFARPVLSDNARIDVSVESSRNTSQSKLDS